MTATIDGITGQRWVVDLRQQAAPGSNTTPYFGWEEGNEDHRVWVQKAIGGDEWESERTHLRHAYEIGRIDEIAASPFIHAPIDFCERFDAFLISPLAETDLERTLRDGPLKQSDVGTLHDRLQAGLATLHDLGLVHSDVQESNIFRVDGGWRIADLGAVAAEGESVIAWQKDPAYRPLGLVDLSTAVAGRESDLFALAVVLKHATEGL